MSIQENPFEKSLDLWRQFGEESLKNTLSAWESGLEQSLTFQKQVHETTSRALTTQFEIVSDGLKVVEEQATELFDLWSGAIKAEPEKKATKKA